ncbi:hypothetical protein DER44DRAFT_675734 [Fusarium oxysporum]|nr:hypothetical protein DER44DRAFT_675734 [Fusarium oxysporum]
MSFEHDKYEQSEHTDKLRDGVANLEMFLCALEVVCTYPENNLARTSGEENASNRFPTLGALVHASLTQNSSSDIDIQTLLRVEKSLERFTSGPTKMTDVFFNLVGSFCDATKQAKNHAEAAQRDVQGQDGRSVLVQPDEDESYPRHVYDTLYKALSRHIHCCCSPTPSFSSIPVSHLGRLELKESLPSLDDEVLFHTVFSKKGLTESHENIKWQHLQFRVPKYCTSSGFLTHLLMRKTQETAKGTKGAIYNYRSRLNSPR